MPEKRTQACPRTRSAVRRRPSLPRSVRVGPPDRHQQRRLAPFQATPESRVAPSSPLQGSIRPKSGFEGPGGGRPGAGKVRKPGRGSLRTRRNRELCVFGPACRYGRMHRGREFRPSPARRPGRRCARPRC
ncbi:hypothetical protein GQF42_18760 [Streptomyces broussonetiae]|uniref:Uncharacterized protein n=1 Tax=Streptomyces broussonetiae TaxID=2686304 RepID=A0A6I6N9P7_9ACTN|nr:hypothetical protein GQF42_18760 [Streptomyces broussonetiae]